MKTGVLKLTALSVVLGIGVLVVMQAQRTLDDKKSTAEDEQDGEGQLGADADETPSGLVGDPDGEQDDPIQQAAGKSGDDEDDVVPAARKLSRANRPQPRRPTATPQRRPSRNPIEDEELDSEQDADQATKASVSDSDDEPRSPASRATADRTEDKPSSRTIRLKSLPLDSDEEFQDDTESASDESVESAPRKTVVTPSSRTGGLSVPDDEDESLLPEDRKAQPASKSSEPSTVRDSRKSVIPASGEDDVVESTGESDESSLGSNLADSDEGFKPREKSVTESPRSKTPPARSRFTDDEEDGETEPAESSKSESSAAKGGRAGILSEDDESSDEAANAVETSKPAKHGEPSKLVDDEGDEAPLAGSKASKSSAAKNRFAEDDEPVGGAADSDPDAVETEAPSERTETIAKNPGQGGRSATGADDDDESLIERQKAETPPAKKSAKAPATPADDETDDDPLSIRGPAKRTKMTDADDREAVPGRLPTGVGGAASIDDGGEPPAPRRARPKLTIEKKAPDTAVIGRPMVYEIVVRNTGLAAARGVTVEDVVPTGVRIDGSKPQGQLDGRRLSWRLGTMDPGATQTIAVRVTPQSEGTVGGVATVHFESEKEGASKNGPRLQVSVDAPKRATVGQSVNVTFKIRNVGPTDAQGVLIHDVLPAALRHPQGDDLEYEIGDIPAGGMREVQLQLIAAQAGSATNRAVITADGAVSEETVVQLDVIGPALSITRTGPKKLNPNKKGRFTNTVSNPTATALTNVTVVETIPAGMEFLDATDNGQYDPTRRTVTWFVGSLEPKESRSVSISLNTTGRGSQVSVVRASDPSGASGEAVGTASVVGTPALSVEVPDLPGSLDAGQEAPVSVRIYNRGTDAASNTRITLSVPSTMELASIDGPAKYQRSNTGGARGRTEIRFDPIRSIDVKKFAEIKLVLKGRVAGAGRLRVQAACDQIPEPIQREDDVAVVAE